MLTIQDAGIEILGDNPKKLYFFCGSEYGIKVKYLEHLKDYYKKKSEAESVEAVISSFKKKSLIERVPELYIVRYDSEFLSSLNDKIVKDVNSTQILGTLVCLYEDESSFKKLDKYFPENVVRFDNLNKDMISKYLCKDFPDIDKTHISYIAEYSRSYSQSNHICYQVSMGSSSIQNSSKGEFLYSFGLSNSSSEDQFRIALAAKSFPSMVSIIDNFEGDLNYLLNCICNTMVELDKILCTSHSDSPLKQYCKSWTIQDIYYMFNHTYNEIFRLRSNGVQNVYDSLIYLASLTRFKSIPSFKDVI